MCNVTIIRRKVFYCALTINCPTCPVCEEGRKPKDSFLALIAAPARRALERENITTLEYLAEWSENEIINLHGMGPSTIPKLKKALKTTDFLLNRNQF